jgi:phage tail sheath protein FI
VFIEETPSGVRTIEGVSSAATVFVGQTPRGPVGKPVRVSNLAAFAERFGRPKVGRELALAVQLFFANGGRDLHVVRIAPGGGGAGKRPGPADLIGDRLRKTGLRALERIEHFTLLALPDTGQMTDKAAARVAKAAVDICAARGALYLMDPPRGSARGGRLERTLSWLFDNKDLRHRNAALYLPRLRVRDPSRGLESVVISPSGAIAGLYARNDVTRGVWKAPAGTELSLRGVEGLEEAMDKRRSERLHGAGVNALRDLGAGRILVWGDRTLEGAESSEPEWKYVNVRRFLNFLEHSVDRGTQWAVFEPNDEPLWAQLRLNVSSFMNSLFRRGAFQGSHPAEAYFVRCDRETTSESDREKGIVNVLVGVALFKPAEFVIIRIPQKTLPRGDEP